jgi:RNA polymerase primary sigma factor
MPFKDNSDWPFFKETQIKVKLGYEPSDAQWAASKNMSVVELNAKLTESSIATEKLALSNIRLVVSIARMYRNMGIEMADLIQVLTHTRLKRSIDTKAYGTTNEGSIGLLHGIEKFDASKGFMLSTYVYWWIRQGITRAIAEHSRTIRLPTHLHDRLGLIRNAKLLLTEKGVDPTLERIATTLNMSLQKVKNATEAPKTVISIDKEAHEREGTQVLFLLCVSLDFINQIKQYIGDIGPFSFVFIFVIMLMFPYSFLLNSC